MPNASKTGFALPTMDLGARKMDGGEVGEITDPPIVSGEKPPKA
jgi:hypothetical protein